MIEMASWRGEEFKIGIDPGTQTGVAVWCPAKRRFEHISTEKIHKALSMVRAYVKTNHVELWIEDPNTWKPFGEKNYSKLQGAGSIKRDFAIWKDFCEDMNVPFHTVKLQGTLKKLTANQFKAITNYHERTSVHGRDAAMLVYDR